MYQLTNSPSIIRTADGACIPADPANTDYAAYLKWLDEGNTPTPAQGPDLAALRSTALAQLRAERQPIIGILDGLQASALTAGNTALAQDIETAKQGLRDITNVDLSACQSYEEMRQAAKARYAAIVAAAPAGVVLAFKGVA